MAPRSRKPVDDFARRLDGRGVRAGKRHRAEPTESEPIRTGRVLANYGIACLVRFGDDAPIRLPIPRHLSAVAGDIVHCDDVCVRAIEPRGAVLARADRARSQILAANIDRVVLVQSAADPPYRDGFTDRYQVFAAVMGLPLVLALNKIDRAEPGMVDLARRHEEFDVRVVCVSATNGDGLNELADAMRTGTSVLSGHSGVGKSSILARLVPGTDIAVGELHPTTGRGRQTTTTARAYPFGDGFVIDTPGVRQFSLIGVEPTHVVRAFADIAAIAAECRYRDCLHAGEPNCAVVRAVNDGRLAPDRYASYRRIVESLQV